MDRRPPARKTLIMRAPRADDTELMGLIDRYVDPGQRYRKLLHGNFEGMSPPELAAFLGSLVEDARTMSDHDLGVLLESDWRARITAAWLIGVSGRDQFRARLGELLRESRLTFAGQGYCVALALFGTGADAEILAAYLDHYLRQPTLRYDQEWAFAALRYVDAARATQFTRLWEQWVTPGAFDQRERIGFLLSLVEEAVRAGRGT